jgi:hypothetical protein
LTSWLSTSGRGVWLFRAGLYEGRAVITPRAYWVLWRIPIGSENGGREWQTAVVLTRGLAGSAAAAVASPAGALITFPGRQGHSTRPLAGIGWHSLGIYTVDLLPLLSFSAEMTEENCHLVT